MSFKINDERHFSVNLATDLLIYIFGNGNRKNTILIRRNFR